MCEVRVERPAARLSKDGPKGPKVHGRVDSSMTLKTLPALQEAEPRTPAANGFALSVRKPRPARRRREAPCAGQIPGPELLGPSQDADGCLDQGRTPSRNGSRCSAGPPRAEHIRGAPHPGKPHRSSPERTTRSHRRRVHHHHCLPSPRRQPRGRAHHSAAIIFGTVLEDGLSEAISRLTSAASSPAARGRGPTRASCRRGSLARRGRACRAERGRGGR